MQTLTTPQNGIKESTVEARTQLQDRSKLKRALLFIAEVVLVLAIVGLLIAIWLPAWIGPHPGQNGRL